MSNRMKELALFNRFFDIIKNGQAKCTCRRNPKLLTSNIDMYEHDGGIDVPNEDTKQWVYVTCELCEYQWSFTKILRRSQIG